MTLEEVESISARAKDPAQVNKGAHQHLKGKLLFLEKALAKYYRLKPGAAKDATWEKVQSCALVVQIDLK